MGRIELSPRITRDERRAVTFWLRRMPPGFEERLPPLKLAVAEELRVGRSQVWINEIPEGLAAGPEDLLHAASFIPERYLVLNRRLFARRVELGRILYHELSHFVWTRLGNPKRKSYEALVRADFRERKRGELGYSSEWRKRELREAGKGVPRNSKYWREYICESFCDTAAYVLLGSERRAGHSEYTLNRKARERRKRWMAEQVSGVRC